MTDSTPASAASTTTTRRSANQNRKVPTDAKSGDGLKASSSEPNASRPSQRLSRSGLLCGAIAALGYTMAATVLRELSKTADPAWVSTIKACTTILVFVPVLLYYGSLGKRILPEPRSILALLGAGVFVQLAGNLLYQWSLGQIGLALVVPLTMGTMVVSAAVGGWWVLGERISKGLAAGLAVLVVAIVFLSLGGERAGAIVGQIEQPGWWILAGLAACSAGLSYAVLGITIRASLKTAIPLATPMVFVGLCGVILLGSISFSRLGWQIVEQTSGREWALMWTAGICNSIAFLALTYSLKRLAVIYVNAINVSQVAMAALIGIYLFWEPSSTWLLLGLGLMLLGFLVIGFAPRTSATKLPAASACQERI